MVATQPGYGKILGLAVGTPNAENGVERASCLRPRHIMTGFARTYTDGVAKSQMDKKLQCSHARIETYSTGNAKRDP